MLYPRAVVMLMGTFRDALRLQFNGFTETDLAFPLDLILDML